MKREQNSKLNYLVDNFVSFDALCEDMNASGVMKHQILESLHSTELQVK